MPVDWTRYPADWKAIVQRIRQRSGDRCECSGECGRADCQGQRCEARQGQPHPVSGSKVVLTTAHLDHDPSSRDESRMRHLCQRCHLHLDRGLHVQHARQTRVRRQEEAGQMRLDEEPYAPDPHEAAITEQVEKEFDAWIRWHARQMVAQGLTRTDARTILAAILSGSGHALALQAGIEPDLLRSQLEAHIADHEASRRRGACG